MRGGGLGRAEVLLQREVRRTVDAVVGNDVQILRLRWSGKDSQSLARNEIPISSRRRLTS